MQISIWLSFEIACGTLVLGSILVWLMPESLKYQKTSKDDRAPHVEAFPSLDEDEEPLIPEEQPHENISGSTLAPPRQLSWWEEIKELFEIPGLRFCFALFFIVPIGLISKAFVYQVRPPPELLIRRFMDADTWTQARLRKIPLDIHPHNLASRLPSHWRLRRHLPHPSLPHYSPYPPRLSCSNA